jgi:hypothetical protein
MSRKTRYALAGMVCLIVACVLRISLRPSHLWSDDCYNFADALKRFEPEMGHPQPPGYPLFVLQSKLIHLFVPSVEDTFLVGVIFGTAIALLMTLLLGREMFGSWLAGVFGALLLLVNPTFIFTGLTSTIRVYEAAVPLVIAYFCFRLWRGDRSCWWMAALALGVGSGYRPQLLALLFPLWAWSAWRAKRNFREFAAGFGLVALSSSVWIGVLLSRFVDFRNLSTIFTTYLNNQFRNSSPVFGAPLEGWLRMLGMLIAWNGLAVAGWILFRIFAKPRAPRHSAWFLALWIVPSIVFHALIHIGAADQALVTIAALCLIGGGVFASLAERSRPAAAFAVVFAAALNLAAFWRPISLYPFVDRAGLQGNLLFMRKQITDAMWETSWECFRDPHDETERALATFRKVLQGRPKESFTVWNRSAVSWRVLSHYFPKQTFCLMQDLLHTDIYQVTAECWQDSQFLRKHQGSPVPIPLGDARRIIWVVGETSPARVALGDRLQSAGPGGIYWTPAEPMELPGFRFVR